MASSIQILRSSNAKERPLPGNLLDGQPALNTNSEEPGLFFKATDGSIVKIGPAAITSDGNPPNAGGVGQLGNTIGELWLDKSLNVPVLKVYDGSQWIDAGSGGGGGGAGTFIRWIYTAIGGETSLSGLSAGVLLQYQPGLEQVFINGALITRGIDYNAFSGSNIIDLQPLIAGDVVTVVSVIPLSVVELPGQVTLLRWSTLATAGQTVLSGADSSSQQLAYTAGLEEVYVNGAFLRRGVDYTATNGSTITVSVSLVLNDEVTVMAWTPFVIGSQIVNADVASNAGIESSKLTFLQSGSGAISRNLQDRLRTEPVDVRDFGAVPDTAVDSTAAIQAAIDSVTVAGRATRPIYLNGLFRITDKLVLPRIAEMFGNDRINSGLFINQTFNMSASGVIGVGQVHEPGPCLHDFGIYFYQDTNNTVRSNVIQYPPAIDFFTVRCPRFVIENMRIERAWNGIDARSNNGGSHIVNVEISALNKGIMFDGALDFVFLDRNEFWPYGIAGTPLMAVYSDGNPIFAELIEVDSLVANNLATFRGRIIIKGGFGLISQINLDGKYARLEFDDSGVQSARFAIGSLYSTSDAVDDFAIRIQGSNNNLNIGSAWFEQATDLTASDGMIQISGATNELTLGNFHTETAGSARFLYMTGGTVNMSNGYIQLPQNFNLAVSHFFIGDGRISLNNINALDKGTGTGNLIEIVNDECHALSNIVAPGWPVSLPNNAQNIMVENCDWATKSTGTRRLGGSRTFQFTGSLDGSGNATITHGVASLTSLYPLVDAYREIGGTMHPVTISTITNSSINLSAGAGNSGQTYYVTILLRY